MPNRMVLTGIFVLALAAQPLVGNSLFGQDAAPQTAPEQNGAAGGEHARPHRQFPKPTNLQVLPKDTTPEHLREIMQGFAGALGVECNFCHAPNPAGQRGLDFASDAKPDKTIARTMIEMTQTINEQYLTKVNDPDAMPEDKHVSCGTCHRGHSMPEHFVPPPEHHGPPPGGPGAGGPGGGSPPPQ
ncbi:MAG: c-type cytochrome [Acidobacteriaceae bacterium]